MVISLDYYYSLDDSILLLVDRSIFVQEVFLPAYLLGMSYNSHENNKKFVMLKNENYLYLSNIEKVL